MINGKLSKKLRTYKGYHQKEIADTLGVCQQYIFKLKSSKKNIEKEKFRKLLNAIEISEKKWEQIKYLFTPPSAK